MKKTYLISLFVLAFTTVTAVIAAPPGSPFDLGETLDPVCAPGDPNCTVVTPASSGENSDITSLDALTSVVIDQEGSDTILDVFNLSTESADGHYRTANVGLTVLPDGNQSDVNSQSFVAEAIVDASNMNDVSQLTGGSITASNEGTGDVGALVGLQAFAANYAAAIVNQIWGIWIPGGVTDGTVSDARSLVIDNRVSGGTVTDLTGIHLDVPISGTGTVENRYGIRLVSPEGVANTSDYAVYQESDFQQNYFAGDVGIGTDQPAAKLNIDGASGDNLYYTYAGPAYANFTSESQGYLDFTTNAFTALNSAGTGRGSALMGVNQDDSTSDNVGVYGFAEATHGAGSKSRMTGVAADVTMSGAGSIGQLDALTGWAGVFAGTVNDLWTVYVDRPTVAGGTVNHNVGILIADQAGIATTSEYALYYNGVNPTVIRANGWLGVGTNNPDDAVVEVKNGTVCVDTNGDDSATSCITAESDVRLKKNLQPIESALEKIMKIHGYEFDWRWDEFEQVKRFVAKPHDMGVIAQEVEAVFPEAMGEEINGYKTVNYQALIAPLIESVKELKRQNDALKELVCLDHAEHSLCQ